MARQPALGCSSSPSHMLLDAVLQNLYDFGECGASAPTWRAHLSLECSVRPKLDRPALLG